MSRKLHRLVVVFAAIGILVPSGSAGAQDLRSPDAQAAAAPVVTYPYQDLRSPDVRTAVAPTVDLRSPDAVDGTHGKRPVTVDAPIVRVSAPVVDDGFQWGDAGVGAGILFALLVLPAGGYALMMAHRRSAGGSPLAH